MLDILSGGLLGSIFGGIFRMAPEVLKWMDQKNERTHELNMFKFQCDLEAQRGQQKLAEIGAQREAAIDVGVMDAFNNAITQQAEMVKAAGGWPLLAQASGHWSHIGCFLYGHLFMSGLPITHGFWVRQLLKCLRQ